MQDSLKSNSLIIRIVSIFLAFLILLSVPAFVYASSILPTLVKIADYADVIIRLANSGLDAFKFFKDVQSEADVYAKEEALINGMGRSDVVGAMGVSGYSASAFSSSTGGYSSEAFYKGLYSDNPEKAKKLFGSTMANRDILIYGAAPSCLVGFTSINGQFARVACENPLGSLHVSHLGVYDRDALDIIAGEYCYVTFNKIKYPVFFSVSEARSYFGESWVTANYVVCDPSSLNVVYSDPYGSLTFSINLVKHSYNTVELAGSPSSTFKFIQIDHSFDGSNFGGSSYWPTYYWPNPGSINWDNSRIVVAAPEAEPETRPSSLMQAIHNYNVDNSYTDNSTTVNYFLAPKDQTPTADNVVSPAIFDEETWVFTEPATGAQYQSTGWTYDYNTRTYDIDLEAGTFTLDGTDVTRIVSQYGNELATITYYDASGNALATDEYNYVMMAASECALNGHTYNANTTKEPTCIAAGERTYTCSACGDQYVEEIAKTDHVYADHTITQESTCTVGGISSKTCSTCGDQITEKLDPLGHDFIAKEITETKYDLPPGTSCPSCSGTNYTFSRSGVIYTLLCSDCNTEWTTEADVTYGSTTYVCSNCGESKIEGDATEETQETWFTKFIYKFKWLSSIGQIYRQLVADITSDAETAAAIADGTVTLDEVTSGHAELGGGSAGSEGSGRQYTAPELAVSFGDSDHYGVDWDAIKPLNLSWYAPHKETVDGIVSGILWLGFLFLLIKRAPSIIQGAEMITEDRIKIDFYNRR